jgi:hypothetical protein
MENKKFTITKTVKEKVNISGRDLPIYKVYHGYNSTWFFRLKVIEGYLVAHKLEINASGGHQYFTTIPEVILNSEHEISNETEWYGAVAILLKELDNQ